MKNKDLEKAAPSSSSSSSASVLLQGPESGMTDSGDAHQLGVVTGKYNSVYVSQAIQDMGDLPSATKRTLNTIQQLDLLSSQLSRKLDGMVAVLMNCKTLTERERGSASVIALARVVEELAEKKLALALSNYDLVDENIRLLDKQIEIVDKAMKRHDIKYIPPGPVVEARILEDAGKTDENVRKRKLSSLAEEPVYCICRRGAFGDMVACDNDDCPTEWFHYTCVGLTKVPKNTWLCPQCRSSR
jgi:hypothetical protein